MEGNSAQDAQASTNWKHQITVTAVVGTFAVTLLLLPTETNTPVAHTFAAPAMPA